MDLHINKSTFLVLFTTAAGIVDANTYIHGKAFPANMTGNTVALAIAMGRGQKAEVLTPAFSIGSFVAGTLIGSLLIYKRVLAADRDLLIYRIFILEAAVLVLIALFLIPGNSSPIALVSATSIAMGLQGAALAQLKVKGVSTITVTSTLTTAVNDLVFREMAALSKKPTVQFGFVLQLQIWLVYAIGAAIATVLIDIHIPYLLLIPAALVLLGVAMYRSIPAGEAATAD